MVHLSCRRAPRLEDGLWSQRHLSWAAITLPGPLPQTPSGSPGSFPAQHSLFCSEPFRALSHHILRWPEAYAPHTSVAWHLALLPDLGPEHTSCTSPVRAPDLLSHQACCLTCKFKSQARPALTLSHLLSRTDGCSQAAQLFIYCVYCGLSPTLH